MLNILFLLRSMWKLQAINNNNSNPEFGLKQIDISLLTHKMQLHLAAR